MKKLRYAKESGSFFSELSNRVDEYLKEFNGSVKATIGFKIKILVMFLMYWTIYAGIFFFEYSTLMIVLSFMALGVLGVMMGLNIGHDAAHNAIFKKRKHNQYLLWIFEMLGTNGYNWVNRHLGAHHVFPNVMNYDSDIQQTSVVKIFPKDKHLSIHKFQYLYMPILYLVYILRWVLYRDFKDVKSKNIGVHDNTNYPISEVIKMIVFKLFYVSYTVIIPGSILGWGFIYCVLMFLVITISGSMLITLVLLSTHVGEDAEFPEPNEDGLLPYSWSEHQVITTADFATESLIITSLFGGFNHHVIHHLFPQICHCHYSALTPILKELAENHGLKYKSERFVLTAVLSHFKLLYNNSKNNVLTPIGEILEH
ncbi:MAG: acyl-CoA desaturase [Crocinitomicaceae bacterium]|nr:acyl-CoA desaturase [Crocinitomicaceae bacterium]